MKPKPKRGRPSFTGETGQRYQVTIPPTIADRIRARGGGSLSQGIIRLVQPKSTRADMRKTKIGTG